MAERDPSDVVRAFLGDVVAPLGARAVEDDRTLAELGRRVRTASAEAGIWASHLHPDGGRSHQQTAAQVRAAARTGHWLARHVVGAGVDGSPSTLLRHARPHVRDHHLEVDVARGHLTGDGGLGSWTPRPPSAQAVATDAGHRLRGSAPCSVPEPRFVLVLADTSEGEATSDEHVVLVPADRFTVDLGLVVLDDAVVPSDHALTGEAVELRAEALATTSCFSSAWVLGLAAACHDRLRTRATSTSARNLGRLRAATDAAERQLDVLAARLDAGEHDPALAAATQVTATSAAHRLADAVWQALPDDATTARLADEVRSLRPRGEAIDALETAISSRCRAT